MTSGCAFCGIVAGDVDAAVVAGDEHAVTFLDHRPLFPGHCLVVPRAHRETLTDVPSNLVHELFLRVQAVTAAVARAMEAEGTFVAMNNYVSQSVPHLHIHVVPRRRGDGLRGFFWPRNAYEDEDHVERTAAVIRDVLGGDGYGLSNAS